MSSATVDKIEITAVVGFGCFETDEKKCKKCRDRFRCWTNTKLILPVRDVSIRQNLNDTAIEITAEISDEITLKDIQNKVITLKHKMGTEECIWSFVPEVISMTRFCKTRNFISNEVKVTGIAIKIKGNVLHRRG